MKQLAGLSAALALLGAGLLAGCGGNGSESKIAFVRFYATASPDVYTMKADVGG